MARVEHHVGRLVEVIGRPLTSSQEHEENIAEMLAVAKKLGRKIVVFSDSRFTAPGPPSVVATVAKGMVLINPFLERSGILLLPGSSILTLQFERGVVDAANPLRRLFSSTDELKAWLGEVLNAEERDRLDEILR